MTPAERAVIEAALAYVRQYPSIAPEAFGEAVRVLLAERSTPATPAEKPVRWDQVVSEDEIYSTATKKWYRVRETKLDSSDAWVTVHVEGVAKPFTVKARDEVLCRRSETGKAVDTWVQVLSSR